MSANLLELFFDDDYYHKLCADAGCKPDDAFNFYQEHLNEECVAPNEFFIKYPQYLYYDSEQQNCRVLDWIKPLSKTLKDNEDVVKFYDNYASSDIHKIQHIKKFIGKYAQQSLEELENLLGKGCENSVLDSSLIKAFLDNQKYQLNEESISYFEKLLKAKTEEGKNTTSLKNILINYAANFATNAIHAVTLSKFLNDSKIIEVCGEAFLSAIDKGREFQAEVFTAFEKIILEKYFNEKLLSFMAYGAMNDVYYPQDASIQLFKQYFQKNPHNFMEAISSTFEHALDSKSANLTLIDEIIEENAEKSFLKLLPLILKEKIASYYTDKTNDFKDFSSQLHSFSDETIKEFSGYKTSLTHLTSILEKLVDYDSKEYVKLPKYVLDKIIAASLTLTTFSKESNLIKKVIFIITRLGQQHVELPQDVLSYFAKMITDQDPFIKRLAVSLYKKLSYKFIVSNADELLSMDGDLDTKSDIVEILENAKLNEEQQAKLIELKNQLDEKLEEEKRQQKSNEIMDAIKAKNLSSWNEYHEELLKIQINRLFAVGWRQEFILKLIKQLSNDSFEQFARVMGRIYDYGMSHRMVDRNGNSIVEIIEQQAATTWLPQVWRLFNDNNYYDLKDRAELIDELIKTNEVLNTDGQLAAYLNDKLDAIAEFASRNQYSYKFYMGTPVEIKNNEIAFILKNEELYIQVFGQEEHIKIGTKNDIAKGFSLALYNKINNQLPNSLSEFSLNTAEEKELLNFLATNNYACGKKLSLWNEEDFKSWRQNLGEVTDKNIAEIIAVLKQAVKNT